MRGSRGTAPRQRRMQPSRAPHPAWQSTDGALAHPPCSLVKQGRLADLWQQDELYCAMSTAGVFRRSPAPPSSRPARAQRWPSRAGGVGDARTHAGAGRRGAAASTRAGSRSRQPTSSTSGALPLLPLPQTSELVARLDSGATSPGYCCPSPPPPRVIFVRSRSRYPSASSSLPPPPRPPLSPFPQRPRAERGAAGATSTTRVTSSARPPGPTACSGRAPKFAPLPPSVVAAPAASRERRPDSLSGFMRAAP